jgi:hypothetical protein
MRFPLKNHRERKRKIDSGRWENYIKLTVTKCKAHR